MRLNRRMVVATMLVTGIAASTVPALAAQGGSVARYQMMTIQITTPLGSGHNYTGELSPCDGSFTATGTTAGYTEDVTGVLTATTLNYASEYEGTVNNGAGDWDDYGYAVTADRVDATNWVGNYVITGSAHGSEPDGPAAGTVTTGPSSVTYANHGAYVSANGGGSDAAHSCIGMPVQSNN